MVILSAVSWIFYDFTVGSGWKGNDDAEKMVEWWITLRDWDLWICWETHLAKRSQVSEKNECFLGCFGQSLFTISYVSKIFLCSVQHSSAATKPNAGSTSTNGGKIVSQHILPLLQRWHRGPG